MPTDLVAEQFRAGESNETIADLFDLTVDQVEQVLRFELSLVRDRLREMPNMALRWFVDESALGLGKLLPRIRDDVIFAGHPDLPEIPLGTIDVGWMSIVADAAGWQSDGAAAFISARWKCASWSEVDLRTIRLGGKKT